MIVLFLPSIVLSDKTKVKGLVIKAMQFGDHKNIIYTNSDPEDNKKEYGVVIDMVPNKYYFLLVCIKEGDKHFEVKSEDTSNKWYTVYYQRSRDKLDKDSYDAAINKLKSQNIVDKKIVDIDQTDCLD